MLEVLAVGVLSILTWLLVAVTTHPTATPFVAVRASTVFSTPAERAQGAGVTHKLESAPPDDRVNKQGEVAFKRLIALRDVAVMLCPALVSEFDGMKYAYAHMIMRQYGLASAAFQIENPDKVGDGKAITLPAVESVLKTYQAIVKQKPDVKPSLSTIC